MPRVGLVQGGLIVLSRALVSRRYVPVVGLLLCVAFGGLMFSSAPALAVRAHIFSSAFGSEGTGNGQFKEPSGVAVNNSTHGIYVVDKGNNRVERFGSTGAYLGQFNASNTYEDVEEAVKVKADTPAPTGVFSAPEAIAVDSSTNVLEDPSAGDVYVVDSGHGVIDKFSSTGAYIGQLTGTCPSEGTCAPSEVIPFGYVSGVAVDTNGELWVAQYEAGIDNFSSAVANEFISSRTPGTGYHTLDPGLGFAVDSEDNLYVNGVFEEVYKLNSSGELLIKEERHRAPVAIAVDLSSNDAYVDNGSSVGVFDPTGVYTPNNLSVEGSLIERFGSEQLTGGGGSGVAVDSGSGPSGGNVYVADSVANKVDVYSLEPLAKPTVGESVANVASDSATLGAQINPNGLDTTYYFQYGPVSCTTSPSSCIDVPAAPGTDIGSAFGAQTVSAPLQNLQPSTVYHYRVLATNTLGTFEGPDQTFTTQALGGTLVLPDGRAWEQVSPVETLGAQVIPFTRAVIQASEDGSAISYYLTAPFVANPPANVMDAQAISRRGPGGWSTEDIATPHDRPTLFSTHQEYVFFSSDLSHALVQPLGETPLSKEAAEETPYEYTPYVRDDTTGVYTALVTPANVPPGTKFDEVNVMGSEGVFVVTATPDLSHVVLSSQFGLTPGTSGGLYEWAGGKLTFIGDGKLGAVRYGELESTDARHAISDDGSRVFWAVEEGDVYMTDTTDGEVVSVSKAQGVPEPSRNEAHFQSASSDGSLVFFSDEAQLTVSPGGGLYVYDVETGKLTLVTVPRHGNDEFRQNVLGTSEDGSYVYLVDRGVLSETPNAEQEKAVEGGDNLYVLHDEMHGSAEEWTPSFITALSAGDEADWEPGSVGSKGQTAEVSPNGLYVAFMSERSLTGYDNRDASSGERDEEVYLYDAAGARLVCASCDPTGARPSGWLEPQTVLSDSNQIWTGRWVAATLPESELNEPVSDGSPVLSHHLTYLTDKGRLFFNSRDALVPQDVNGVGDVYEYEPKGVGSCASGGGCVALLSGGAGPDESVFADASANGNDVFFASTDRLAPQDLGTYYVMYDAHVCSAEAPCPSSVVAPPPCTTADSCKGALSPQPGVFGAPASATFNGAGNVAPTPTTTVKPKTKPLTRAQKLAKALKACKQKPKKKRPACQKQARRAYGPARKANKSRKGDK